VSLLILRFPLRDHWGTVLRWYNTPHYAITKLWRNYYAILQSSLRYCTLFYATVTLLQLNFKVQSHRFHVYCVLSLKFETIFPVGQFLLETVCLHCIILTCNVILCSEERHCDANETTTDPTYLVLSFRVRPAYRYASRPSGEDVIQKGSKLKKLNKNTNWKDSHIPEIVDKQSIRSIKKMDFRCDFRDL